MFYWILCVVVFSHRPHPAAAWLGWRNLAGRWLARACFGVRSRDIDCPYRLLRREILPRMPLQSRSSFAHVELLAKANFLGHLIAEEVPLSDSPDALPPPASEREGFRDVFADARRVFSHPDFGPAHLPVAPAHEECALGDHQPDGPQ
jgi:hypothetical protein